MARNRRLTAAEVARQSASTVRRVRELARIGVLRPDAAGRFQSADVQRVAIAAAYERGGIELPLLAQAIRDGYMSFDFTDRIYPEASPPSGLTVADLMREMGAAGSLVPDIVAAMGLQQPTPDRPLSEADVAALRLFVGAWAADPVAAGAALRAARLAGDAARRSTEGWVDLFMEAVSPPPEESTFLPLAELEPRLFEPASRIAEAFEPTMLWLLRQHLTQALNRVNVEAMERALEVVGARPVADREPPAIVFADLSGFTRITEEHGDAVALRHAEALGQMSGGVAVTCGGRFVKQLGDGVMLAFEGPAPAASAASAALGLRAAAEAGGLPPLHIGIAAGPVIERDGDYYGRTVNLASRLSGVAGPGEILLDEIAAGRLPGTSTRSMPPATLKGLAAPVRVFRLEEEREDTSGKAASGDARHRNRPQGR